jgi:hypothetical protein
MGKVVLIDGRFELLNRPDRVDIFDIRNLQRDESGRVNPVVVIPLDKRISPLEAGKRALKALRDSEYLMQSEYFHFLDIFLTAQPEIESTTLKDDLQGIPNEQRH